MFVKVKSRYYGLDYVIIYPYYITTEIVFDINYVGPEGVGFHTLGYMQTRDIEQLGLHSPDWLRSIMSKMLNLTLQTMPAGSIMLHYVYPGRAKIKSEICAPGSIMVAEYATAGRGKLMNVSEYPNMPDPQAVFDIHDEVSRMARPTERVTFATSTSLNAIWPALGPKVSSPNGYGYISPLSVLADPGRHLPESLTSVPIRLNRAQLDKLETKFYFVEPKPDLD